MKFSEKTRAKFRQIVNFALDRLSERGTWQGIGFFAGTFVSKDLGQMDWGLAAFIGGAISGIIKIIFPDATKTEINVTVVPDNAVKKDKNV